MRAILAVVMALGLLAIPAASVERPSRPNIIVIVADDLGYADLGVHGLREVPTPHIDSLAREGVRCTSGYVSGTYCSPTRAGLLTGRYQQRFGYEYNPHKGEADVLGLPTTETTFADRMKALGYATGAVGKWHLGVTEKFHPLSRGFDAFYGFVGGAHSYFPTPEAKAPGKTDVTALTFRAPIEYQRKPVAWDGYLTDRLGAEAASFVERHREQPFFLYLAFNAVHTPMHASEKYLERVKGVADPRRRTYLAMLSAMDDAVGTVLSTVHKAGLDERTLIVFISDNGGPTDKYAVNGSSNGPLRGSKGDTWEGGVRVPFLVRWKGRLPAGKVYDEPVIQLDLLPTALAAAGGEVRPEWKLDGVDLLPYLSGKATGRPHDALFWRMGRHWGVRQGNWKAVQTYRSGEPALFNLSTDLGETRDLRAQHPQVYSAFHAKWQRWNAELSEPRWVDPNPDPYAARPKRK